MRAEDYCRALGIDFRQKEFLGEYNGRLYGTFRYPGCDLKFEKTVMGRNTDLIVGSDGTVYRCHSDLYEGRPPVGNITDPDFQIEDTFRVCGHYGRCNPCDIKVKTNRFQEYGHTSVEIQDSGDIGHFISSPHI